jgi:hypothetical protein
MDGMNRRDDVYHPPVEPEPEPDFRCPRCRTPVVVIMGNVAEHDCPARKKQVRIPPQFERAGRDWMA